MKTLLVNLFGTYVPTVYTSVDNVDIIPDGLAGVDFVWCSGVFLFAITLYCVFRLIGGMFNVKRR